VARANGEESSFEGKTIAPRISVRLGSRTGRLESAQRDPDETTTVQTLSHLRLISMGIRSISQTVDRAEAALSGRVLWKLGDSASRLGSSVLVSLSSTSPQENLETATAGSLAR
jgi:hypothetical protein